MENQKAVEEPYSIIAKAKIEELEEENKLFKEKLKWQEQHLLIGGAGAPEKNIELQAETNSSMDREEERERVKLFKAFMEHSPAPEFIKDADLRYVYVNPAYEQMLNRKFSDLEGKNNDDIYPPEVAAKLNKIDQQVITEGKPITQQESISVNGIPREWLTYKFPIFNSKGKPYLIGVKSVDITELKRTKDELKKNRDILSKAQKVARFGNWCWDIPTNKVTYSDEINRIYYDSGAIIPSNEAFFQQIHPDDRKKLEDALSRAVNNKEPFDIEYRLVKPEGVRYVHEQAEVFSDEKGTPVTMIGTVLDITDRKVVEEKLRKAKETAEEATRLKDRFVTMVAHDLRAPFATILGFLGIINRDSATPLSDKHRVLFRRVEDSAANLAAMIDNLLKVNRFQTGKITPHLRFFDACSAALKTVENYVDMANQKGVTLACDMPATSTRFYADYELFCTVLQNIISNSIKFCNRGDNITVFIPSDKPGCIAVKDTGIGIREEFLPKLFLYEEKTSTTGTMGEKGSGLGLPFAMDIINAHKGTIAVESTPGIGSVFYVHLPYNRPKVLVVDDNPDIHILLREYLKEIHVETIGVENGEQALAAIEKDQPHLILTDIMMPVMDGFTFIDKVKKKPATASIPLIVLTSDNQIETRDRSFCLGADDFISMPFVMEELIPRIRRFIL